MRHIRYANLVGSLMYAMLYAQFDICFVDGLVSYYQSNPQFTHWQAIKRIMYYLCGTIDLVFCYYN